MNDESAKPSIDLPDWATSIPASSAHSIGPHDNCVTQWGIRRQACCLTCGSTGTVADLKYRQRCRLQKADLQLPAGATFAAA